MVRNRIVNTNIKTPFLNNIISFSDKIYLATSQRRNKDKTYISNVIENKTKPISNPRIAPPILFHDNQEIKIFDSKIVFKNYKISLSEKIKFIHKIIFRKNDVVVLDDDFLFILDFSGAIVQQIKLPSNLSENVIYKNDFVVDHQEN